MIINQYRYSVQVPYNIALLLNLFSMMAIYSSFSLIIQPTKRKSLYPYKQTYLIGMTKSMLKATFIMKGYKQI